MHALGKFVTHARPFMHPKTGLPVISVNGKFMTVNAATLRYQDWLDIDRELISVATPRLVGVGDLLSRGLTHSLGNIGITQSLFERQSDLTDAEVTMAPETETERDRLNFDTQTVPVPFVHKDFTISARAMEASRNNGGGLDMTTIATATRKVAEKSEDMLFAGAPVRVDGSNAVYGYTTHPDRNTVDLTKNWNANDKTGQNILDDVLAMMAAARADFMFGPFTLYIPGVYETVLDKDFSPGTSDNRTIRERLLSLNGLQEIKVADRLTAHNVVLVQMTRETVDMAVAQDISALQWDEKAGLMAYFKVLACWVPRVKSDFDGRSGVVHLRAA